MGIFGGTSSKNNDADEQKKQAHIQLVQNEIHIEEENIKTIETERALLHDLKTKLELDHKKASHGLSDDLLLIKKKTDELHVITVRADNLKKETERIAAEMRENEKKLADRSRELLRCQAELKQEKKRLQDEMH